MGEKAPMKIKCLGFCGADDTVDPRLLAAVSQRYDWVEWGVLFRNGKEGDARFASHAWVEDLHGINKNKKMLLAAHLCAKYAEDFLAGDMTFVKSLAEKGFTRFQLNATKANDFNIDTLTPDVADRLRKTAAAHPELEFIVQRNEETRPLWEHLLSEPVPNISFLFDESKGRGTVCESYPPPPPEGVRFGYTGGLKPSNIEDQINKMAVAGTGREIWLDMESSLRTKLVDGADMFDVYKAMQCIRSVINLGYHPENDEF